MFRCSCFGFSGVFFQRQAKERSASHLALEVLSLREQITMLKQTMQDEGRRHFRWIRVSSPCTDLQHWESLHEHCGGTPDENGAPERWRWWPTWCPCCRRPLDVSSLRDYDVHPTGHAISGTEDVIRKIAEDLSGSFASCSSPGQDRFA